MDGVTHHRVLTLVALAAYGLAASGSGAPRVQTAARAKVTTTSAPIRPDEAHMRLDDLGIYRVGFRRDGAPAQEMPIGWSAHFDEPSGISCLPFGEQGGRRAWLLHCPWRGGVGFTFQEFTFKNPMTKRIVVSGATAMKAEYADRSDGATFRVLVNGRKLMERHQTDAQWRRFSFELQGVKTTNVIVRFETDPGPKRNASFDYSLWGDRSITFVGLRASPPRHPEPPDLDIAKVVNSARNGVAPSNGFPYRVKASVESGTARLRYEGGDGVVEYVWTPSVGDIGRIRAHAAVRGGSAHSVDVAYGARIRWTADAGSVTAGGTPALRAAGNRVVCEKTFRVRGKTVAVNLTASVVGKALLLSVACGEPVVEALDAGTWGPVLRRTGIPVPYYGTVYYARQEGLFLNSYLDWTVSSASSHSAMLATYSSLTDRTRRRLKETAVFAPAWHLAEVLPNIPNVPSPYRGQVGRRIVLDVWGGRYADIARRLEALHGMGLTNCTVLIHDWQRSGYDNALPMHLPAAADKGGDEAMKTLVSTATRLGYLIALHENYVDYYPNYDNFDERHIALDSSGKRVPAWYNPGTKIQSFAIQPNAILPLAETQSPEINRRFRTNACYLDVHSAVPPWFHVDHRASEEGSGTFARVREAHRDLFAYERRTHGGPVFGEGNNHWYWSGMLDGVEAQFGTGWPANAGLSAPLMADFNLLKVHPLQINHGQGYYERWWDNLPWGAVAPLSLLDQYRVQEIVYGHTGFLGASTWSKEPLAWLEHHLTTPVTATHSRSTVRSIHYYRAGKWLSSSAAAQRGDWSKPRIVYANGLTIIANNGREAWRAHGATLPQHGWISHGAGVTAYTAIRDGVVCDYAETNQSVFANARPAQDWNVSGVIPVAPSVRSFRQTGPRRIEATYAWSVAGRVSEDYGSFVHFSAPTWDSYDEGIRFQQDHQLPGRTSMWRPGETVLDGPHDIEIPASVPDGVYTWTMGFYRPDLGRPIMEAPSDRSGRCILGTISISRNGTVVSFEPHSSKPSNKSRAYLANLNVDGRIVTFSTVRTNGSVLIRRERDEWVAIPFPRGRSFSLELNALRFAQPERVRAEGGAEPYVRPVRTGSWWRLPLNGASSYRWRAGSP